jgi:hypothetical protein
MTHPMTVPPSAAIPIDMLTTVIDNSVASLRDISLISCIIHRVNLIPGHPVNS